MIGVEIYKKEIDEVILFNLYNWKIDRILKVNLSILRFVIYELLYDDNVLIGVVINEVLEIIRRYLDEKSVLFINGVLDKINKK